MVLLLALCGLASVKAQGSADSFIAAIEGPQSGREGELVALSLEAAMQKAGVPGLSVAVIRDFAIHWTRGYGVSDVVAGSRTGLTRCSKRRRSANRSRPWRC